MAYDSYTFFYILLLCSLFLSLSLSLSLFSLSLIFSGGGGRLQGQAAQVRRGEDAQERVRGHSRQE
jgi:hypothetical protein